MQERHKHISMQTSKCVRCQEQSKNVFHVEQLHHPRWDSAITQTSGMSFYLTQTLKKHNTWKFLFLLFCEQMANMLHTAIVVNYKDLGASIFKNMQTLRTLCHPQKWDNREGKKKRLSNIQKKIFMLHTRAILSPIMFSLTERHWCGAV